MMPKGLGQRIPLVCSGFATAIASALLLTAQPSPPTAQAQAGGGGALTVRSDIQEANTVTGVVTARGNVRINYPARNLQGTAAQAQYFSTERQLVLTGNVYVLQDGNSIRAERMTYLVDEGRFLAVPGQNEQVESVYLVPEDEEEGAAADPAPARAVPPVPTPIVLPSETTPISATEFPPAEILPVNELPFSR
ncbi:MAG: OstA family protein [Limnothrix sp. RL_2_0]|nr:OstA family protein [Limnothrix sp. RL_2_0]